VLTYPEMFVNPLKETETNRVGIDYVIKKMTWYWDLSGHLLKEDMLNSESYAGLRSGLKGRVVDLYKVLLSYQMKSACSYYQNRGLVLLCEMIRLDDWDGNLKDVQAAENAVLQDSHVYNAQQIMDHHEQDTKLLHDIHHSLREQTSLQRDIQQEEEDNKCLKDLLLTDPAADMKRIESSKDTLLPDSYVWILSHRDFIEWRDGETTRLLRIKGGPGKGKTMLLIGVIRELLKSPSNSSLQSFFFCQAKDPNLDNATAVLRGLIYQMLVQQRSLISHIRRKYDKAGPKLFERNAFSSLSGILTDMLRDPRRNCTYLIVDALDECRSGLEQLLKLIVQILSDSSSRVKWLVSSRHRVDIEEGLRLEKGKIELDLEENVQDQVSHAVDEYINHKVLELARLKKYDAKLQADVQSYLQKNSDGTFLWVALVCKQLADKKTLRRKTLSVLKSFSPGLRPFYQRMMEEIHAQTDSEDLELCKQILAACTLAYRPIRLEELISIAGLPDEFSDDQESLRELVGLCGSFLIIRKATIYIVHQSAQDYLVEQASTEIFPNGRTEEQQRIVSRSIEAMDKALQRDVYGLRHPGCSIDKVEHPDPDPLAPIRYACVYWIDHLCEIKSSHDEVGLYDNGTIDVFLRKHFLHWLEALSLIKGISDGVLAIAKLIGLLTVSYYLTKVEYLRILIDLEIFV
jgi:hypothetical protein